MSVISLIEQPPVLCHSVTTNESCALSPATVVAGHRRWTRSWAAWTDWSPLGLSWGDTCWSPWVGQGPGELAGGEGSPPSSVCRGSCSPPHCRSPPHRSQCSSRWFSPGSSPSPPPPPRTPPARRTPSPQPGPAPGSCWGRAGRAPPSSLQQLRSGLVRAGQG